MSEEEKHLDVDPVYRPVVEKFGREMFTLVFNAGMGRQAAVHLCHLAEGMGRSQLARSRQLAQEIMHATSVLTSAFNEASSQLAKRNGWTAEQLEECERAIESAVAAKIEEVKTPKIVLH